MCFVSCIVLWHSMWTHTRRNATLDQYNIVLHCTECTVGRCKPKRNVHAISSIKSIKCFQETFWDKLRFFVTPTHHHVRFLAAVRLFKICTQGHANDKYQMNIKWIFRYYLGDPLNSINISGHFFLALHFMSVWQRSMENQYPNEIDFLHWFNFQSFYCQHIDF